MTRILYVTNGLRYGGAERIIEALAVDLAAQGHQIRVVATTRDGPIGDNLRARGIGVDVLDIASPADVRVIARLAQVARAFQPDFVHSHLAVADIATALAPLPGRTRRITTVHNPGVELDALKKTLWRAALTRFDRVVAVGTHVRSRLSERLPCTIVNPSLIELETPSWDRERARAALGVPLDVPLVLGVGRLSHVKGFDLLDPARCLIRTPGALVRVIGEGPEEADLRARGVPLVGGRGEAAELLAAADVVVCPSRSEGFPQVPLQAMAAARPVVATRVGGTPEVVVHDSTGILVPPEDPLALARAVDALLADPARATALGQAGRQRLADQRLTRASMVEKHRVLYADR